MTATKIPAPPGLKQSATTTRHDLLCLSTVNIHIWIETIRQLSIALRRGDYAGGRELTDKHYECAGFADALITLMLHHDYETHLRMQMVSAYLRALFSKVRVGGRFEACNIRQVSEV